MKGRRGGGDGDGDILVGGVYGGGDGGGGMKYSTLQIYECRL